MSEHDNCSWRFTDGEEVRLVDDQADDGVLWPIDAEGMSEGLSMQFIDDAHKRVIEQSPLMLKVLKMVLDENDRRGGILSNDVIFAVKKTIGKAELS